MHHDVGAVLDRPAEIRGGERIVDDQRQTRLMRDIGDSLDIDDHAPWVGEVLDEDRLALWRERLAEVLRLRRIDEMAGPAELFEGETELGERAAIKVARGDELVARLHEGEEREKLRRMA